ncbi:hypothetical protein [Candidatus Clostridium radicumherbarum]|uniref:Uncharacterized protein n=1 Tax=Candidatus Clostridium radicumherbarum TaxID=3381662 RepID=A0ABW8TXU9_9CLOT
MRKEVKPAERSSAIPQKTKKRNGSSKKRKKQTVKPETSQLKDIDYVEELKTQLTYGDTGHGVILDKKV